MILKMTPVYGAMAPSYGVIFEMAPSHGANSENGLRRLKITLLEKILQKILKVHIFFRQIRWCVVKFQILRKPTVYCHINIESHYC